MHKFDQKGGFTALVVRMGWSSVVHGWIQFRPKHEPRWTNQISKLVQIGCMGCPKTRSKHERRLTNRFGLPEQSTRVLGGNFGHLGPFLGVIGPKLGIPQISKLVQNGWVGYSKSRSGISGYFVYFQVFPCIFSIFHVRVSGIPGISGTQNTQ